MESSVNELASKNSKKTLSCFTRRNVDNRTFSGSLIYILLKYEEPTDQGHYCFSQFSLLRCCQLLHVQKHLSENRCIVQKSFEFKIAIIKIFVVYAKVDVTKKEHLPLLQNFKDKTGFSGVFHIHHEVTQYA